MSGTQNWQQRTKRRPRWMLVKSTRREENRQSGSRVKMGASRFFLKFARWNRRLTTSKAKLILRRVGWRNQTGADPPIEAVEELTCQSTQVGAARAVKNEEEERNVNTVLLVGVLGTWPVIAMQECRECRETANDYSGGTQNSRQ